MKRVFFFTRLDTEEKKRQRRGGGKGKEEKEEEEEENQQVRKQSQKMSAMEVNSPEAPELRGKALCPVLSSWRQRVGWER